MNGVQCSKSLYLTSFHPELKDVQAPYDKYIMETGTRVGVLARELFKNGILIDQNPDKQEEAIKSTQDALADPSVEYIFEAAFNFDDIIIRIDVLKKIEQNSFEVIEVKSSTKVKEEYLTDIAIQCFVLQKLKYKVSKCTLIHVNSDYVYEGGAYDLQKLFTTKVLTEDVNKIIPNISDMLGKMREVLSKDEEPRIEVGSHCKKPNKCAFYNYCRKDFPDRHITKLYRISNKELDHLRGKNINLIGDIPEDFKLSAVQKRIRECVIENKIFIGQEVEAKLSELQFPLYFMDFETSNPALPIFPDSSPWQHIPFQWSVHILDEKGNLDHKEYLPNHTNDPRREFCERLVKTLGKSGSVLVYYDTFEKGILDDLIHYVGGELGAQLQEINERIFDLYKLIFDHVYHPSFNGSFSIKKVLPALVPRLTYEGMNISDGGLALMAYPKILDATISEVEKANIQRDLKEYCKLDTFAMVEIYRYLMNSKENVVDQLDDEDMKMITIVAQGMLKKGYAIEDIRLKLRKRFQEKEIDASLRNIRSENIKDTDTVSLKKEQAHYGWYEGPQVNSSSQWSALCGHLKDKENAWIESMITSLDKASTAVVSHLAPPQSKAPCAVKGLVLGHIQSGKTANFSAVIAKAVDEGYKLIIILAGMHNNLRMQTEARLRAELVAPHDSKTCTTLTDVDENGDFQRRQPVSANSQLSRKDGFVLVVLKKNSSVLRNFKRWLDDANKDVIKNCPTLVIDDESDQASINTNKIDQDPTAINSHIRDLIGRFSVVSYVGYTATPFANVFIDSSVTEDIYPSDFLVTLEKPEAYYGPEELFGRNEVNGRQSTDGLPVIRKISEEEAELIRKMAKGPGVFDQVPDSLRTAIQHFIIGGAIRLCRGQWKEHISMLVHISHLTDSHSKIYLLIESYLEGLKHALLEDNEAEHASIKKIWEEDFKATTEEIVGQCDDDFESIWKNAKKLLSSLELIMDNSNSNERLTFERSVRDGFPFWGIVVGGNTLSRGLTLEGLTCSYFVRSSKAYDTLLQMGRWFGYRKGYVDVTRIFVPDELYRNFYELATIEQEIRDEISLMASNEERPVDVALRIRKIPNMLITAGGKSRSTRTTYMSYSGTKVQTHQIRTNDTVSIEQNRQAVEKIITGVKSQIKPSKIEFTDLSSCFLFKEVPSEYVMQFLDGFFVPKSNSKFSTHLIQDYIHEQQKNGNLNNWSIAIMSLKNGNPIRVGDFDVVPVTRNVKHDEQDENGLVEATLRAVSTPGEELIDLGDQIDQQYRSTDQVLQPKNGPRLSDVKARFKFRPRDRGLLLIYPLNSNINISDEEFKSLKKETKPSFPLRAVGQVFAISIVFPYSEGKNGTYLYLQNKTV